MNCEHERPLDYGDGTICCMDCGEDITLQNIRRKPTKSIEVGKQSLATSEKAKMAKNENKEQETLVDLGETGVIELPKIDVSKYIGNKSTIERVTERKGMHGYYVKVESAVIETIGEGEKAIELRASRILGLQQDEKGNIGWGEDTKTAQYLKKMGVAHYKELAGKEVVIQTHMNNGTEFLTF